VTDQAALRRLLRETDPRHYSAMHRTAQVAHATVTSQASVT
jgi:hypothetical protein